MPITVQWDTNEQHAVRYDFSGQWTVQELDEAFQAAYALARSRPDVTVHAIANFLDSPHLPDGAVKQIRRSLAEDPPNSGYVYIVQDNMFIQSMLNTFSRIYKDLNKRLLAVDSLEEARAHIAKLDTTAQAAPPPTHSR